MKQNQKVVLPASMIQSQRPLRQGQKSSASFLLPFCWIIRNSRFLKSKFMLSGNESLLQGLLDRYKRFRKESKPIDCVCWMDDKKEERLHTQNVSKSRAGV
ncbi:MAG: hypothetical protein K2Q34_02825 [Alphaproteobacteria bacterium]|nr:hypothetical protein [Alphaproteobacteria bacterium]